jgi:hypothetical protein
MGIGILARTAIWLSKSDSRQILELWNETFSYNPS